MGEPGGENPRLAGAGAGENEKRALCRFDRQPLFGVEALEIGRLSGREAPSDKTSRPRRGDGDIVKISNVCRAVFHPIRRFVPRFAGYIAIRKGED
jgi:hypothetical protein